MGILRVRVGAGYGDVAARIRSDGRGSAPLDLDVRTDRGIIRQHQRRVPIGGRGVRRRPRGTGIEM
ncbi:MAG: hypothetical protein PUB69_04130 [Desulfovibrionaceae bacterium]|nr:hypothetical protein [Desulfovibrionaceae bacterium]